MTSYETPQPITADIDLDQGNVNLVATDRTDTVVNVKPTNPDKTGDVRYAENTRVSCEHGKLVIKTPKVRSFLTRGGSVDITVELPTGSTLTVGAGLGYVHAEGQLGDSKVSVGAGEVNVDQVGRLKVRNGSGVVRANVVAGNADVDTASSVLRIGRVDGTANIRNTGGNTTIGEVAGDITVKSATGEVTIDRAERDVTVKIATGVVRLREVVRGSVAVDASSGEVEIGVRRGSVAWLDLKSVAGRVRNSMEENAPAPEAGEEKVEVRARLVAGDILVHHA